MGEYVLILRDWVSMTPKLYEFHADHKAWEGTTFLRRISAYHQLHSVPSACR